MLLGFSPLDSRPWLRAFGCWLELDQVGRLTRIPQTMSPAMLGLRISYGVSLSFRIILVTVNLAQNSYEAFDEIRGPTTATLSLPVRTNRRRQTAGQTRTVWFSETPTRF